MLGGLVTTSVQKNKEGLPWVSRIPLLGYLFGRTSNKTQRDELIVMIQPTVLNNADEQFEHPDAELSQYRVGDESWESTFPRDAQKPKWIPVTPDPSPPLGTEPMPTP